MRNAMQPLVSILIPAYNAQEYLAQTIVSALDQTWPRKEIIIVDDGSKDQTLSIARRLATREVKVETQSNQGAAATRNRAYSLAQGDYIQWLDADDLLSPDKVALQMEAAAQCSERTVCSCAWGHFIYRVHKAKFEPTALWDSMPPLEWMTRKMEQNLHMQTATWLVSRTLTDLAGPWNRELLSDDDGEYFARVLMASDRIQFVPGARVYYRLTPSSRLSYIGRSHRKMEAQLSSMELNIRYIRSVDDSPRVRAACVTYLRNWHLSFYPERPDLEKKAQDLAGALGGQLPPPTLSWKYIWIQRLFGWIAAKRCQQWYNMRKSNIKRLFDKALYRWEMRPE